MCGKVRVYRLILSSFIFVSLRGKMNNRVLHIQKNLNSFGNNQQKGAVGIIGQMPKHPSVPALFQLTFLENLASVTPWGYKGKQKRELSFKYLEI